MKLNELPCSSCSKGYETCELGRQMINAQITTGIDFDFDCSDYEPDNKYSEEVRDERVLMEVGMMDKVV